MYLSSKRVCGSALRFPASHKAVPLYVINSTKKAAVELQKRREGW